MMTNGKMKDVTANGRSERALREIIRKELGSETNRRFLTRMSAFQPDREMPDNFGSLLGELDRAEQKRRAR